MSLDIDTIRRARPENELHYFKTIGSTMTEASRLALAGAPHGTIVLANEQTGGIGRLGRTWESEADAGIYCSILLRLPLSPAKLPVASLVLGLATADAIQQATDLVCDLRWPNDVLIDEHKVAGILPHLVEGYVVAGIGINVNQVSFPPNLRTPATSLRMQARDVQSREDIVVKLLRSVDLFCSMLLEEGAESIMRAFMSASSYVLNRRVVVEESGSTGVTAGLDANGFLLLRSDAGGLQTITAGGLRPTT